MRRGDLITVSVAGDFGKPRPALVVQADESAEMDTVTVPLMSASLADAPLLRLTVQQAPHNGLRKASQVMVDRSMTLRRAEAARGEFATDEQMRAIWAKHGL